MKRRYDLLVIGELNVDLILTGRDVTPVFGQVEKLVDDATLALGGSSAIVACGASRLGLRVGFVSQVGDDEFGHFVSRTLQSRGVDIGPITIDPTIKTGLTLHLSHGSDRAMLTYLGSMVALRGEEVNRDLFEQTRHVHVGSFFLQSGLQPALSELFAVARAAGATVSLDPGWDPVERWDGILSRTLEHVDVFLPNTREAIAIARARAIDEALDRLAGRVPLVVTKLGAEGACARRGAEHVRCSGFQVEAIDTTGAGDSFDAGFLYGYLNGLGLEESLRWGCACGALATTRVGGIEGQPTVEQVKQLITVETIA